ncbi:MAG: hypothetical protein AB7R69_02505 [Candidatus Babeliales bacterium]
MKNIYAPLSTIFLLGSLFLTASQPEELPVLYKQTVNQTRETLMSLMDTLHENKAYWQETHYRPLGHFIERGPYAWFFGQPKSTDAIELLEHEINRHAASLCMLKELENTPDYAGFYRYLYTLSTFENLEKNNVEAPCMQDIHHFFKESNSFLQVFKKNALARVEKAQKPGHLQRNWLAYTAAGIGTVAGLVYYAQNQQSINSWAQTIKNTLFDFFSTPSYKQSDVYKEVYKEQIKEFFDNNKTYTDFMSQEELEQANNAHSTLITPKIIVDHSIYEAQNALSHTTIKTPKALPIVVQRELILKELFIEKAHYYARLGLAALASYGTYKGLAKLYHILVPAKKNNLKEALLELEGLYIQSRHSPMNKTQQGLCSYWLAKAQTCSNAVPLDQRSAFEHDLALLSSSMSTKQNYKTLVRMHRAYEFLI